MEEWTVMGDRTVVRKSKCTAKGTEIIAMGRDRNGTCILGVRRVKGDPTVGFICGISCVGQSCRIIGIFR